MTERQETPALAPSISAAEIKKSIRELGIVGDKTVPLEKMLSTLANHEAVIRMLAGMHPKLSEFDIQSALANLSSLLGRMKNWANPSPSPSKAEGSESVSPIDSPPEIWEIEQIGKHNKVKINIDGGSKGNPGPAFIGIVVRDLEDRTIFEEGRYIGKATNNQAEYAALIEALKILVSLDRPPEAYFFSDSELLVKQMTGLYKVKNPQIQEMISEAQKLRRRLPRFQIAHVRRELNRRADEVGNLAWNQYRDASKR